MPRAGLDPARVVEEAARIADEQGLDVVTLAAVAQSLGVRPPSLYNHVEGRPGLLRLLTLRSFAEIADVLRDAAVGRAGADALRSVGRAYRAYAREYPGRYLALQRAADLDDLELARAGGRAVDVLVAVISAWGFRGDDALQRVRVIRAGLHGFITLESQGGFGLALDLDESFELVLDTLVAGLDARPAGGRVAR